MRRLGKTPPFRSADGEVVPGSIAEIAYRRLGGLDQWVMIRGESVANPPLILLHGGPGLGETGLVRHYNAALERHFTVVYWVPAEISLAFIDALTAPSKQVVWFEHSGHEPFVDEPAAFNAAMVELVAPA